ncbi:unnamed protein product, partial [Prorocentrum cordatum]
DHLEAGDRRSAEEAREGGQGRRAAEAGEACEGEEGGGGPVVGRRRGWRPELAAPEEAEGALRVGAKG